jgi:hypothetical protein
VILAVAATFTSLALLVRLSMALNLKEFISFFGLVAQKKEKFANKNIIYTDFSQKIYFSNKKINIF